MFVGLAVDHLSELLEEFLARLTLETTSTDGETEAGPILLRSACFSLIVQSYSEI